MAVPDPVSIPLPPPALPPPPLARRAPAGSDALLALLGGLAVAGAIPLALWPPVAIAWAIVAPILAGLAVRRARHAVTVELAMLVAPLATVFAATCLTGYWGWLVVGIVLLAMPLVLLTPIGFGLGRFLRPRIPRLVPVAIAVVVIAGLVAAIGWGFILGDAIAPESCPPGIGA